MPSIRNLALETAKKSDSVVAVFSGKDNNYKYAVSSMSKSVREFSQKLNAEFSGRGGGSDELVQGNINTTEDEIRKFLAMI